ncbi:MAG: RecQ family ATP-dependent DNA helicase [Kiritimatiellae bacterium]|nr:RecQ family ATP-dependent DNA helicase [Kiritimatiellia bacterium]
MDLNNSRLKALAMLRSALGDSAADFRPGQWEAIAAVLAGRRQLLVQRTGWGKSMVYFLASRLLREAGRGFTLLISPLLSLMRDQIRAARERLGVRAATINSENRKEWALVQSQLMADQVDVLFISPERLANEDFQRDVLGKTAARIALFVVDEAHCISDWGHDFRPDYRRIVRVLQALPPGLPVLATTATANERVVADVVAQLGELEVVRGPLARDTLELQNIWMPNYEERMAWLAEHLGELPGSGGIYVLTRRDANRLARWLKDCGWPVEAYHSGLDDDSQTDGARGLAANRREQLEERLRRNEVKALVSTVALGMGFDKPDLGFVVHMQRPPSLVHYYQQVGRAGRAVERAVAVLLGGEEDEEIIRYFIESAMPPHLHVVKVLEGLNRAPGGVSVGELQEMVNLPQGAIEKCLKFLAVETPSPVSRVQSRWMATPVEYRLDEARARALRERREAEQREMTEYLHARDCLMARLCRALDDPAAPCGRCANCRGEPVVGIGHAPERTRLASQFLRRCYVEIAPRVKSPSERVAAAIFAQWVTGDLASGMKLFATGRFPMPRLNEGRALCLWGDGGWGRMVREDKYQNGRFRDELVEACAAMVREWAPRPPPTWVTCIPSRSRPELVPDFARRLAERLGLPFAPALIKVKDNQPQKFMQNSAQQALNVCGVFQVDTSAMRKEPVLLVDDVVDSRWTMTVAGVLLMGRGCPAVWPVALASSARDGG